MGTRFKYELTRLLPDWNKQHLIYGWTWIWFFLISAAWLFVYFETVAVTGELFSEYELTARISEALTGTILGTILGWVGAVLVWWRIVKVVVLHGSPFAWGRKFTSGRIKRSGGPGMGITLTYIGDVPFLRRESKGVKPNYDSLNLLYGAVFRPHPRSDKLVRSRLEYLILALPFSVILLVTESKIKFGIETPGGRAELYDEHVDRFEHEIEPSESRTKS